MNYETMTGSLAACIGASKVPVIMWGPPGQGKTSVVNAIAKELGWHIETVLASIREPSDFAGLPNVVNGRTELIPPGWALRIAEKSRQGEKSILFLDEISTAPPSVQSALLRVVLDKTVGDLYLGDDVVVIAAANPPEQATDGWDLAPPMANRFIHIEWELPADVVQQGLTFEWPEIDVPNVSTEDADKEVKDAKILISSFLTTRRDYVTVLPKTSTELGGAFPTPRSWENAALIYGYAKRAGYSGLVLQNLMVGTVGHAAAVEFLTFAESLDLPDPEEILAKPKNWEVPKRVDKTYAILSSTIVALEGDNTGPRWQNFGEVLAHLAENKHTDLAVIFGKRWIRMKPDENTSVLKSSLTGLKPILEVLKEARKD